MTPHDRIAPARLGLFGPDGRRLPRIAERRAPTPRQHVGLDGWVAWSLVDRRGREVAAGEQHNLILNTFLDLIGTAANSGGAYTSTSDSQLGLNVTASHAAVGTGSTAPAVTDTALVAEIGRTSTKLSSTVTRPSAGVYEFVVEYEFDFAVGNGNLTEFAIANASSGGVIVRELFRDELGDPITITKTSDFKLRIKYTHTVTLTPTTLTAASLTIDGIGTLNGDVMWYGGASTDDAMDMFCFSRLARGAVATSQTSGRNVFGVLNNRDDSTYTASPVYVSTGGGTYADTISASTYTGGTYTRKVASATWSTARSQLSNLRHIGIGKTAPSAGQGIGFSFRADDGDRFTKDDLHLLTITDLVTVSWDRA